MEFHGNRVGQGFGAALAGSRNRRERFFGIFSCAARAVSLFLLAAAGLSKNSKNFANAEFLVHLLMSCLHNHAFCPSTSTLLW